jgi:hypothetical protein
MRIASGLSTTFALLIGSTRSSWAQVSGTTGSPSPSPAAAGSTATTVLTLVIIAAIVIVVIVGARLLATRRKQVEQAVILQSQLSDFVARESRLRGLRITPKARVSGWHRSQIEIEIAGEVPTPELRETVMRIVGDEAHRSRPDVLTLDHLFIVPPLRAASDTLASRG